MIKARMSGALTAFVLLALAGCGEKETGPEEDAPVSAPATAGPVPAAIESPAAARPLSSFAGMDDDGDGYVSSAEHAKAAQTMFRMTDADRDGAVSVGEMDAAQMAMGGPAGVSSEKKIAQIDGDGDGNLTLAEYVAGSNAMFAQMDVNKDDRLDRAEWDKGPAMPGPDGGPASSRQTGP
jgi:hypothetical protein